MQFMCRVKGDIEGNYNLVIYTDGAFSNSRNRGGYAFVVNEDNQFKKRYFRGIDDTTNQRTEMLAVISAFRYLLKMSEIPKTLIISDSMYVVGTTCEDWKMNANIDLWKIYFYLYDQLKDKLDFKHVRGHQGVIGNELADVYSVIASEGKDYNDLNVKKPS